MSPQVAWIHVAPIKSLQIQELEHIELTKRGVENDRRFCIVDPEGRMLNAKRVPAFVSIRPHFSDDMRRLTLYMPDGTEDSGPVDLGDATLVSIYHRSVPARVVEGPWADALSAVAGRPVRLVRFDEPGEGVDRAAKGAGATLLGQESLRAIAEAAGLETAVDPRRFRMLIGVSGTPPHEEDTWIGSRVRVGGAVVIPKGNVGRCAVTTLDPLTAVSDLDTLAALASYRGDKVTSEPLAFGVWARIAEPGAVNIGDDVVV
jgi:uncharacterized protein YcbX